MLRSRRIAIGVGAPLLAITVSACSGGGTVATVNGEPITRAEYNARLEQSPASRATLQQLVQETLIEQYAKTNNITVTDAEITAREDQIKANFPGDAWNQMLASRGLSEADVRSALRDQVILDKALSKDVKITPAQIKEYYDKNHAQFDKPATATARQILVSNLTLANQVEADLKAGQSFADLAKKYSIDPVSKDKGGDLGSFRQGQMVPAFDKYAFSAPIGAISPPIKSPFGYHIVQVESRVPAQKSTLASATPQVIDQLRQQQEAPLAAPFQQSLLQKADIKVIDPQYSMMFPTPAPTPSAPPTLTPSSAPSAAAT
jgi:foldase protein PrsA